MPEVIHYLFFVLDVFASFIGLALLAKAIVDCGIWIVTAVLKWMD